MASNQLFSYHNIFLKGQLNIPIGDIMQVSELSLEQGCEIVLHTQACDEITYVIAGSAHVESDDRMDALKKGDIHFIRKGLKHRIVADENNNLRFVCIGFLPNLDDKVNKVFFELLGEKSSFIVKDNDNIKQLSELLIHEFYSWDADSTDVVNRYMEQIITMIFRLMRGGVGIPIGTRNECESSNSTMYKMLRYIDSKYLQISSVSDLSEELSYSKYYLSHLFKARMGITIKEYIIKKKISHAIDLLKTSNLSVEELAGYLNFSSSHTFRHAFKQYTGKTPTCFIRKSHPNEHGQYER